jgi:hypothetical protein
MRRYKLGRRSKAFIGCLVTRIRLANRYPGDLTQLILMDSFFNNIKPIAAGPDNRGTGSVRANTGHSPIP